MAVLRVGAGANLIAFPLFFVLAPAVALIIHHHCLVVAGRVVLNAPFPSLVVTSRLTISLSVQI